MGVDVDEAGGEDQPGEVDLSGPVARHLADCGDATRLDADCRLAGGGAGTVDHLGAAQDQVHWAKGIRAPVSGPR